MKVKMLPIGQVKAGPEDGLAEGEFIVYPSTFIRRPDSYGDVVAKGAFARTIRNWKDSGNVMPGLFGHRMDDPDFYVAGASDMGEDEHGWWVRGRFDLEDAKAAKVYRLVKGRRITQLSFAYDVVDEAGITLSTAGGDLVDGKANELRDLDAYEFSFVPLGANTDTSVVSIKSRPSLDEILAQAKQHLDSLQAMQEALTAAIAAAEGSNDDSKASTSEPGQGEGAGGADPDPMREVSADLLALRRIELAELV